MGAIMAELFTLHPLFPGLSFASFRSLVVLFQCSVPQITFIPK
ncbi:hypothetical protein Hdeb2414_s0025g00655601 [Helianthus debilis subsp. tardiflorus]